MSGEELKQYIKRSGLTMSDVAREMGTTPQNVQARLGRKNIKVDFIQKIKEIIDKCAPPLPAEMESAVIGSHIDASNSKGFTQTIGTSDAVARELELLRKMVSDKDKLIETQQKHIDALLAIVGQK